MENKSSPVQIVSGKKRLDSKGFWTTELEIEFPIDRSDIILKKTTSTEIEDNVYFLKQKT